MSSATRPRWGSISLIFAVLFGTPLLRLLAIVLWVDPEWWFTPALTDYAYLHFATHGDVHPLQDDGTGLLLSPTGDESKPRLIPIRTNGEEPGRRRRGYYGALALTATGPNHLT